MKFLAGYEESVKFFLADETIFNNKKKLNIFKETF